MTLLWKIALAWGLMSVVSLLVLGLVPTSAGGAECGRLFGEQPLSFVWPMTPCSDLRSVMKLPATFAAVSAALGLLVAFFAYASASGRGTSELARTYQPRG